LSVKILLQRKTESAAMQKPGAWKVADDFFEVLQEAS
jgi:hypothetical protein